MESIDELIQQQNRHLEKEIDAFTTGQIQGQSTANDYTGGNKQTIEPEFIDRLYRSISSAHAPKTSDEGSGVISLDTWRSFFLPIAALARLRHRGSFLAARMVLYLTQAFFDENAPDGSFAAKDSGEFWIATLSDFVVELDEMLLPYLRNIWTRCREREGFSWASIEHPISRPALATGAESPKDHNGRKSREPDPKAIHWQPRIENQRMLLRDSFEDAGPLRIRYYYSYPSSDKGDEYSKKRPALRRSRQFIADARRLACRTLQLDREHLVEIVLCRLPLELQHMIQFYLEPVEVPHPYLEHLELSNIYQSFNKISQPCTTCKHLSNTRSDNEKKRTCPRESMTFWNLPLRCFQTLHKSSSEFWVPCMEVLCTGHHADTQWRMVDEEQLYVMLERVVQSRCGPDATLKSVGLDALEPIKLHYKGHAHDRGKLLFPSSLSQTPEQEEAEYIGSAGLVDVMLHGRTLLECWTSRASSGGRTIDMRWLCGRTRLEEVEVSRTFTQFHHYCDFCRLIVFP